MFSLQKGVVHFVPLMVLLLIVIAGSVFISKNSNLLSDKKPEVLACSVNKDVGQDNWGNPNCDFPDYSTSTLAQREAKLRDELKKYPGQSQEDIDEFVRIAKCATNINPMAVSITAYLTKRQVDTVPHYGIFLMNEKLGGDPDAGGKVGWHKQVLNAIYLKNAGGDFHAWDWCGGRTKSNNDTNSKNASCQKDIDQPWWGCGFPINGTLAEKEAILRDEFKKYPGQSQADVDEFVRIAKCATDIDPSAILQNARHGGQVDTINHYGIFLTKYEWGYADWHKQVLNATYVKDAAGDFHPWDWCGGKTKTPDLSSNQKPSGYPVTGFISTLFGQKTSAQSFHTGVDIAAGKGTTAYATGQDVSSASSGTAAYPSYDENCAGRIYVQSENGRYRPLYLHLSYNTVTSWTSGKAVNAGQYIGKTHAGAIGLCSSGTHLHYEIFADGAVRNPMDGYVPPKYLGNTVQAGEGADGWSPEK